MNHASSSHMDWVSVMVFKIDIIFKVKWQTDFAFGAFGDFAFVS